MSIVNTPSIHEDKIDLARAAYYGDKSIGLLDGGSAAGRLVFESLAALASSSQ